MNWQNKYEKLNKLDQQKFHLEILKKSIKCKEYDLPEQKSQWCKSLDTEDLCNDGFDDELFYDDTDL